MLGCKGTREKGGGSINEHVKMDVRPHKMKQDMEWLYLRKVYCSTNWEKDDQKSIKVVWTCTKKVPRGTKDILYMRGIRDKSSHGWWWVVLKQEKTKGNWLKPCVRIQHSECVFI